MLQCEAPDTKYAFCLTSQDVVELLFHPELASYAHALKRQNHLVVMLQKLSASFFL
jgi:hypothetical protein